MGVLAAAKLAVVALSVGVATGKTVADAKLPSRELLSSSASGDADAKRAATLEPLCRHRATALPRPRANGSDISGHPSLASDSEAARQAAQAA